MERRRGKGQTMSVVIMNGNKVHIGKRFFIIRPVEYQVKYVLGNVLPFIDLQTSLNLKTLKNHHVSFSHFNLFFIILPISI